MYFSKKLFCLLIFMGVSILGAQNQRDIETKYEKLEEELKPEITRIADQLSQKPGFDKLISIIAEEMKTMKPKFEYFFKHDLTEKERCYMAGAIACVAALSDEDALDAATVDALKNIATFLTSASSKHRKKYLKLVHDISSQLLEAIGQ